MDSKFVGELVAPMRTWEMGIAEEMEAEDSLKK
jgi:hypothetical protein